MFQAREELNCGGGGGADTYFHLRIGSVFVVLVTSTGGALFPLLAKRSTKINIPGYFFESVHPPFLDYPSPQSIHVGSRSILDLVSLYVWSLPRQNICPDCSLDSYRIHPPVGTSNFSPRFPVSITSMAGLRN
jgi:hypothetical protein